MLELAVSFVVVSWYRGDLLILSFAILFLKLFSPQLLSASALPAIDCQWRSADRVDSINYTRAQTQRLGRVANI